MTAVSLLASVKSILYELKNELNELNKVLFHIDKAQTANRIQEYIMCYEG
jgi:hypothetical protein